MNNIETMKLALETFERMGHVDSIFAGEFDREISALRQAIEQAQQAEPVAIKTMSKIGKAVGYWRADLIPPHIGPDSHDITFLYAMPPQRQPLSRKEVLAIIDKHPAEKKTGLPMFYRDQVLDICRAIEAAHGIKGEA